VISGKTFRLFPGNTTFIKNSAIGPRAIGVPS